MTRLFFAVLALALVACGAADEPVSDDTQTTAGAEARECSFGGAWGGLFVGGPYEGHEMTWTFSDDGNVRWTSGELGFDGTWSIDGDVVSVTDTSESGCTGQTGTFRITWQGGCDAVRIETVEDDCVPRTTSTNGMTLERR